MSRAARRAKTSQELERMSKAQLEAQRKYLHMRINVVNGQGPVAKAFRKEVDAVERELKRRS
jgi:hypothetical protein